MTDQKRQRPIGTVGPMTGLEYEHTKFERSLFPLLMYAKHTLCGPDETIAVCPAPYSFPYLSRSHMCRYMDGDWLVMLDSDMEHPRDTVPKLVAAQKRIEAEHGECGVVTGVYPRRSFPCDTILVHRYDELSQQWIAFEPDELRCDAPGPCDASGAGSMLIMRWVVERIVMELNVPPFQELGPLKRESVREPLGAQSDDMAFCKRLRALDPPVQLWYTPDVQPRHLATVGLTVDDWVMQKARTKRITVEGTRLTAG